MPADDVLARVEMRVAAAWDRLYTVAAFEGEDPSRIGYVSQFGDTSLFLEVTRTEGTLGMTGEPQWAGCSRPRT